MAKEVPEKTDLEKFQAEPDPAKRAELFHASEELQKIYSAGNFPPKNLSTKK